MGQCAFDLSGQVLDDEGIALEGVLISAGGHLSATTDAAGFYTLTVPAGSYELVPGRAGCIFEPASRQVAAPPDAVGLDFTGQCAFDLSGQVLDGAGLLLPAAGRYIWSPRSRTASVPPDALEQDFVGWNVYKTGTPGTWHALGYSDTLTYTVRAVFPQSGTMVLYDPVPTCTAYLSGSLRGPAGVVYNPRADAISGSLTLTAELSVTVTFAVRVEVTGTATTAHRIVNRACARPPGAGLVDCTWSNEVVNYTYLRSVYLPLMLRNSGP